MKKNVLRVVQALLVLTLLVLAPTACDSTGTTTYYGYSSYGYGAPVGYPGAWHGGYYGGGYGGYGGVVVVTSGPPIPY